MIAEDYVSFEIAKLLKEKGFDEYCFTAYSKEVSSFIAIGPIKNSDITKESEYVVTAPTLQMAMKYLREMHNIIITMDYDEYELGKNDNKQVGYGWNIQKVENPTEYLKISEHVFDTYEESCRDAIEWCLTNLIK